MHLIDNTDNQKAGLYSALEVSHICGVVNQTVINWIKSGFLKASRTPGGQYRVYPEDLAQFMLNHNLRIPEEVIKLCKNKNELYSKSILVVDDDEGLNSVITKFLGKKFPTMQIYQAFDGFDAGSQMMEKRPCCIILDLDLPGVDGFSICSRIREGDKYGKPTIIIMTALEDSELENKMKELGVKHLFRKPLNLVQLSEAVDSIINK